MSRVLLPVFVCWLVMPAPVSAQVVLTLEETIARAREQAGAVLVARARIAEAEAAIVDASARFRDNPVIEGSAGPRSGGGERGTDLELGLSQQFETGGQRQARIASARASGIIPSGPWSGKRSAPSPLLAASRRMRAKADQSAVRA